MMNIPTSKLCMGDNTKKSTAFRQENCLDLLQIEAENIQKWQVKMEIRLKEKDKELGNFRKTVDLLRTAVLDAKMERDKVVQQLHEELKRRNSRFEKVDSTRTMCILVKGEFTRLEESLNICTAMFDNLQEENEKKSCKIQELTDDLTDVKVSILQALETFKHEYSKFEDLAKKQLNEVAEERDTTKLQMVTVSKDLGVMRNKKDKLESIVKVSQERITKLNSAKIERKNSINSLLVTIGELKLTSDSSLQELQNQLGNASKIIEEKTCAIRRLNQTYSDAKKDWECCEQKCQITLKKKEHETEMLIQKLEDCLQHKKLVEKNLKAELDKATNIANEMSNLHKKIEQLEKKKKTEFYELGRKFEVQMSEKKSLVVEFQARVDYLEAKLQNEGELLEREQRKTDEFRQKSTDLTEERDHLRQKVQDLETQLTEVKNKLIRETSKTTRATNECRQWETKSSESGKKHQEDLKKLCDEVVSKDKKIECLKVRLCELEELKGDFEMLKSCQVEQKEERKKLLAQIQELSKSLDETQSVSDKKSSEVVQELTKNAMALRDCRGELQSYRELLRDTEKMLRDEGEKIVLKDNKIEDQRKVIDDMKYELQIKSAEIVDMNRQILEMKVKVEDCPFTSVSKARQHSKRPLEAECAKAFSKSSTAPTSSGGTKLHLCQPSSKRAKNTGLYCPMNDMSEDLPSEVSFGSAVDNLMFNRKRSISSSTPKQRAVSSKAEIVLVHRSTPHAKVYKQAAAVISRNSKQSTNSSRRRTGVQKVHQLSKLYFSNRKNLREFHLSRQKKQRPTGMEVWTGLKMTVCTASMSSQKLEPSRCTPIG